MKPSIKNSKNLSDIERDLIEGLGEFLGDLKGDASIPEKYTCHRVLLDLEPRSYGSKEVKSTRKLLRLSQALFAVFLGVSPSTVRAWETGKKPSDMACRFMDEIQRNPEYWRNRLAESAEVRTC